MSAQPIGQIEWRDLTSDQAENLSEFYAQVVGWQIEPASMGGYNDYCMNTADGTTIAGVCHNRGVNADIPTNQWLMYVRVADVEQSAAKVIELGGKLCVPCKPMGNDNFCVIQDPSGAVMALVSSRDAE